MAIHQDGHAVACAVDYEGRVKAGNVADMTVKEMWQRLNELVRKPHREHRWNDLPDICKGCRDWQTTGSSYENESTPNARPFWFNQDETPTLEESGDADVFFREAL